MLVSTVLALLLELGGPFPEAFAAPQGLPPETLSLTSAGKALATSLQGLNVSRLAVAELVHVDGGRSTLGRFLSEEITTSLIEQGTSKIVERSQLERILKEQKLQLTDLVQPSTAKALGRIAGVDAILLGTYADLDTVLKVNVRVISVESGEVLGAAGILIEKDAAIRALTGGNTTAQGAGSAQIVADGSSADPGLAWTYYNLAPWSGPRAPSTKGLDPAYQEVASHTRKEFGRGSPATGVSGDYFVASAKGQMYFPSAGTYLFKVGATQNCNHDTYVSLQVGTTTIEENLHNNGILCPQEADLYVAKSGWQPVHIRVEHGKGDEHDSGWFVTWRPPGAQALTSIPPENLRP